MRSPPFVLWFTGLPGSGKTTLASMLATHLHDLGQKVEHLDGDKLRDLLDDRKFDRASRLQHLKRVAYTAALLEGHGVTVIASFISPFAEARQWARSKCNNFVEVYVSTPLAECEKRDPKGLYSRARRGEIKNFTGIDAQYDTPASPEVEINTQGQSAAESFQFLLDRLPIP